MKTATIVKPKIKLKKPLIGFIGQGFIGKNYADDFESRKYPVLRYSLDKQFLANKDKIRDCDIVFIAVPTPSTPEGFDDSIIRSVMKLIGKGKTAVIKSTIVPGTTESIQKQNPNIYVLHSPEFLTEKTAREDATHPNRNIVGIPISNDEFRGKAEAVISVLPRAPYSVVTQARNAELTKYGGNIWFYFKVIYMNMLYDLSAKVGADFEAIREAMAADPRIGYSHLNPVHQGGRGAGGHCFIKDFAAFAEIYEREMKDPLGDDVLKALAQKNISLLLKSHKDTDLLKGVYGAEIGK
ncbi:MAG: UDP-glucose/GDP-mannose dehydrogenase family protein [Candidatus Taylorbacteria bacterium]|nr:UDP-glucose/GDP-mannose dehydrogenase family protein [Candidatus Taylorbacteria bacterium]